MKKKIYSEGDKVLLYVTFILLIQSCVSPENAIVEIPTWSSPVTVATDSSFSIQGQWNQEENRWLIARA